jgi:hypothetical protein
MVCVVQECDGRPIFHLTERQEGDDVVRMNVQNDMVRLRRERAQSACPRKEPAWPPIQEVNLSTGV